MRPYIIKANNQGLITTTAGNDLVHVLGTNRSATAGRRSGIITKILAYNNVGANVTLQFGTLDTVPAFHAYLPTLLALNGLENIWDETMLPPVEFSVLNTVPNVAANNRIGDIYVVSSIAGVLLSIELKEFGS